MNQQALSNLIWSVADLLRGDYRPSDYGKVILPFTVLRRLDCVLAPTKAEVLEEFAARSTSGVNPDPFLRRKAKQSFYNTSQMDLKRLLGDPAHVRQNLEAYIQGFSPEVRDIFERFEFVVQTGVLIMDVTRPAMWNRAPEKLRIPSTPMTDVALEPLTISKLAYEA